MRFNNSEKFRAWLIENLKPKFAKYVAEYDDIFNEWLLEAEKSCFNGYKTIEIPANSSITGCPIEYSFDVDFFENLNGEFEEIIIF